MEKEGKILPWLTIQKKFPCTCTVTYTVAHKCITDY